MKWFAVNNFFEARRPIYRIMQTFCLTSLTVNFRDLTAEQTATDQLRMIAGLFLCSVTLFFGYGNYQNQLQQMSDSHIMIHGLLGTMIVLVCSLITNIIANYVNGKRIFRCSVILNKFDQQLKANFGHRWDYQQEHRIGVALIVFGYLEWIVLAVSLIYGRRIRRNLEWLIAIMSYICYVWTMLSYQSGGVFFTTFLMSTGPVQDSLVARDSETSCRIVRKFALLHDQLCDTVELINRCFTVHATVALATAFGFTVFSLFGLIHSYATQANKETIVLAWSNMAYDGFYLTFIVQLVVLSGLTHSECTRTSVLIHKIVSYRSCDRKTLKELRMFSQQLWHHAPKVSCSLFDFDWPLFYTIVASLTTYLVILVQFDLVNFNYA
ncbi:putative gustatory receptor 28b [Wyeomyia smithii]|uniref:putative gustatory receptor 28b n=1 Tax=Wyeomyia smithii TaxID=174621 RepID=UPI0024681109|nr:putative gustatory receptor 28b [Wyeomyia smithii]